MQAWQTLYFGRHGEAKLLMQTKLAQYIYVSFLIWKSEVIGKFGNKHLPVTHISLNQLEINGKNPYLYHRFNLGFALPLLIFKIHCNTLPYLMTIYDLLWHRSNVSVLIASYFNSSKVVACSHSAHEQHRETIGASG